jgi:hypothetical protein
VPPAAIYIGYALARHVGRTGAVLECMMGSPPISFGGRRGVPIVLYHTRSLRIWTCGFRGELLICYRIHALPYWMGLLRQLKPALTESSLVTSGSTHWAAATIACRSQKVHVDDGGNLIYRT